MTREEVAGFMKYLQEEERRKVDGIVPSTNEIAFGIAIEALQQPQIVRCKDCKHRPEEPEGGADNGFDYIFPDNVCPCKCDGDEWYSWRPSDNWFCPKGERKEGDGK